MHSMMFVDFYVNWLSSAYGKMKVFTLGKVMSGNKVNLSPDNMQIRIRIFSTYQLTNGHLQKNCFILQIGLDVWTSKRRLFVNARFCFKERVTYVALLIIACSQTCNQSRKVLILGVYTTYLSNKSF